MKPEPMPPPYSRGGVDGPYLRPSCSRMEGGKKEESEPTLFHSNHHGLGAIFYTQAMQNFLHVTLDGIFTQIELGSDLAARKSLGDQAQDHDLLRTEWFRGWFIAHVGSAAQLGQDGYSGLGVNRRLSAGDGANRAFEIKT